MAIFTAKNKTTEGAAPKTEVKAVRAKKATAVKKTLKANQTINTAKLTKGPEYILKGLHLTEKATYAIEKGVYVFEVAADATKRDVVTVVQALYGVTPRKVNIVVKQARSFVARTRGRRGTKSGLKKAYVFLKKGEKIDVQ